MANPKHLKILREGMRAWNEWRAENPEVRVDLADADLRDTDLRGANLTDADLRGANFTDADLTDANLTVADLRGAEPMGADLRGAELKDASLKDASLAGAVIWSTVFDFCDLSLVTGLETVEHAGPSDIGPQALRLTAAGLAKNPANRGNVETFLRGAGVPELIMDAFALMIESPIEFYSCFISYSHRDKSFALRIYEALQARGIRCWLDEHQLLPGDDMYDMVDRGIQIWDKVLLCCSEDSLTSWWVEAEIDKALKREQELRKDRGSRVEKIIPLDLDGYLFDGWRSSRASMIQRRLAADFKGWESDHAKFEEQFERVVKALATERSSEPEPKL